MIKVLSVLVLLALSACSSAVTPQVCVPPQQSINGFCVDRDGGGDGNTPGDAPGDAGVVSIKFQR